MASAARSKERKSPNPKRTNISQLDQSQDEGPPRKLGEKGSPDLPSINERLGHLRPSRELLEYYRKKIAEYDEEHDHMVSKLEEYKITYEEQHKLQWELRQREEEIVELQKALSDMQIYLFQEREHVLRLYSENDRLKGYDVERGMKKKQLPVSDRRQSMSPNPEEKYKHDNEVLVLQVEALQAQLQEQTKIAKEQVEALMEDRRVKEEELETRRQRDEAKIHTLTEKLHKTQDLLYESTKDFLELRYQGRANERQWMAEKDRLLRELDSAKDKGNGQDSLLNMSVATEARAHYAEEVKTLDYQLQQAQKLAEMYREQVIQLEDELSRIREEGDVTREIFKGRSDKMTTRLTMMNQRYQDLERRRNLEVEGFKNDIKNLRSRLKDVERQLYKVTMGFAEDMDVQKPGDIDMQILRNVHATAGRSKKMVGELKNLKSKMYGLENDLKHL
ncbi:coiled-coil domain-containing protein 77 [Mytilus galloprovincialis]|uniref:Coiled-coil domain-containing protein 77 n=2 Tax=Mytilus galloprovincialis TaxID=29158 RepID=A0A8B6HGY0_MYTGA|nr:coiled-coil domain-containing protein 77 [Mytilus galloprovincialis]